MVTVWPLAVVFLSTPSVRRATPWRQSCPDNGRISIHALRAEGDRLHFY